MMNITNIVTIEKAMEPMSCCSPSVVVLMRNKIGNTMAHIAVIKNTAEKGNSVVKYAVLKYRNKLMLKIDDRRMNGYLKR